MKASELKNKEIKFKLNDKEYELKFDMNTFYGQRITRYYV